MLRLFLSLSLAVACAWVIAWHPRRSLIAALVVGTILNLINQGDALFGEDDANPGSTPVGRTAPAITLTEGERPPYDPDAT